MAGERRKFRLHLDNGSTLEMTGHLEELAYADDLSRCRIVMRGLPLDFQPDRVKELVLLEAPTRGGELSAGTFQSEGPVGRGNSLLLKAAFPPIGFKQPTPGVVKSLRMTFMFNAILNLVGLGGFAALLVGQKTLEAKLWVSSGATMDMSELRRLPYLAAGALIASTWPILGCIFGLEGIAKRRTDLLALALGLLFFGWTGPLVVPVLLLYVLNRHFKAYMADVPTVLNGQDQPALEG